MKFRIPVLATLLLLYSATMYADTITVDLGTSNQSFTLIGNGASGGYGTYLAQQGTCVAGATQTTCNLTGTYTGTTAGYTAGTYDLSTVYDNSDGGLPATTTEPVVYPNQGNSITLKPFLPDVTMTLNLEDITGARVIPMVVDGTFVADSYIFDGNQAKCSNLPEGVPCSQGEVGLYKGDSYSGPISTEVTFDLPSPVPEPEWMGLGGLIPAAFLALRRRLSTTRG